jgi:SGNH domain (fused to AT3 domains)
MRGAKDGPAVPPRAPARRAWRRRWALAMAAGLSASGLAAGIAHASTTLPKGGTATQVKEAVAASVLITRLTAAQESTLSALGSDNAGHRYQLPNLCGLTVQCAFGDTTSARVVVLYGDSHARMWLSAIIPAAKVDKVKLEIVGEDGCPIVDLNWSGLLAHCNPDRPKFVAAINALHPYAVVLSNRTSFPGITSATWEQGLEATIASLGPSKAKVAIIGDLQVISKNPPQCLAAYPTSVQRCTEANPNHQQPGQERAEAQAAKATKSLYVNPQPWLCTKAKCVPVIGKYFAYWDSYHVSVTYAAYLSSVMGAALKPVL